MALEISSIYAVNPDSEEKVRNKEGKVCLIRATTK